MGGGTCFQILGAVEVLAILSILCGIGIATRHNKRRMFVGLVLAGSSIGLCLYASSRIPVLKDWVCAPLAAFYHLIRFGS